jgi:amidase
VVDPVEIATSGKFRDTEFLGFMYELKADLNAYLGWLAPGEHVKSWLGAPEPMRSLKDIIEFNEKNASKEMPYFGQENFLEAEEKGPLTTQEYIDAIAKNHELAGKEGIDATMDKLQLDAIVGPTGGPAWVTDYVNGDAHGGGSSSFAAVAGYPNITVPAGFTYGLPVGISFFGRAWSEPVLIKLAYAYEQTTKFRKAPRFLAHVEV